MSRRNMQLLTAEHAQETSNTPTHYDAMKWPQLMALGRERKLFVKGDTKPVLIEKLKAFDGS